METFVLAVKRNNYKTPLPGAASRFILRKNLFIKSNYQIGETYLPSNHIED